jgi:hypothetical protein
MAAEPMSDRRLVEIGDGAYGAAATERDVIEELLAEVRRAQESERSWRRTNLLLHHDMERVRMEVGGARATGIQWCVEQRLRSRAVFGDDEAKARECFANRVAIWGADGLRLRNRLIFICDWRDVDA